MDSAGLTILLRELAADCEVARDAAQKAGQRVALDSPGHLEACAYELARFAIKSVPNRGGAEL